MWYRGLVSSGRVFSALVALLGVACSQAPAPSEATPGERIQQTCEDPRPEMCAQVYEPVCAERDTGIRCVTTPCDSSESREYPSACEACRDPMVTSYSAGPCGGEGESTLRREDQRR
jgi:hypothetical protein